MSDALIDSLTSAVAATPDDIVLRLHLARLLVDVGRSPEAVVHCATALSADPTDPVALALMTEALGGAGGNAPTETNTPPTPTPRGTQDFDWGSAEAELDGFVPPMFADDSETEPERSRFEVQGAGVRLDDVGGLETVKERLHASFLAPLRNPELRRLYGKSLRGGLLLYGPPGCGKTFLARAVAGELDAAFLHVALSDVLDMYIGNSERNVAELFATARASAPCVLFLDELDALGQKRTSSTAAMRGTVNQLLTELDGVGRDNEGVFVLAATNHPWDVDPALRRPGRLDRTLLVLPPDRAAREAILLTHLRARPLERIDVAALAKRTDGFSGADLAHLCEAAAEVALMDSVRSGEVRMIRMADFNRALKDVRPSMGPWLDVARNVATFANEGGEYDELAAYLRRRGRS